MQTDVSKIVFDGETVSMPLSVYEEIRQYLRQNGESDLPGFLPPPASHRDLKINVADKDRGGFFVTNKLPTSGSMWPGLSVVPTEDDGA